MECRDELLDRVMVMAEQDGAGWWNGGVAVVAVSGGPDSMALLHMLREMARHRPLRLVAAHVNHRFRGAEADAEAELVARTASSWGIPLAAAEIDVPYFIEETGMNAQSAARHKRYEFLMQTARQHGAGYLLMGHHADDQAETVLMRVLHGTGVSGLAGIPARRRENNVELFRPLLRITKGELLEYCERNEVPYAVDSSNSSRHYLRNAVRLDLIPQLEKINPRVKESLVRLADMAAADDDYLESETARLIGDTAARSGAGYRVDLKRFGGLHVALQRRLIKLILKCCANHWHSLAYQQVETLLEAMKDGRNTVTRFDIGGGWTFVREYDQAYVGPPLSGQSPYIRLVTEFPCSLRLGESGWQLRAQRFEGDAGIAPADDRWEAWFDAGALALPLTIRTRQPGDRMQPMGLNGTKKVQDMFVDAKIPRTERDGWPLVADAEGRIVWIPGLRRSAIAAVGEHTRQFIRLDIQHPEPRLSERSAT